jgi:hypothetical protein
MNMCPKMIEEDRGPWIATLSGAKFYINAMNLCDIPIEDIAHALSMNCRYNGHVHTHYSVAEHSIAVARILERMGASDMVCFAGLLHDISEAFVPDIPRPFKAEIGGFEDYENRLLVEAGVEYDFYYPFDERIKYVDRHIVRSEANRLFPNPPEWVKDFDLIPEAEAFFDEQGIGICAAQAELEWLSWFDTLKPYEGPETA